VRGGPWPANLAQGGGGGRGGPAAGHTVVVELSSFPTYPPSGSRPGVAGAAPWHASSPPPPWSEIYYFPASLCNPLLHIPFPIPPPPPPPAATRFAAGAQPSWGPSRSSSVRDLYIACLAEYNLLYVCFVILLRCKAADFELVYRLTFLSRQRPAIMASSRDSWLAPRHKFTWTDSWVYYFAHAQKIFLIP
jgi:hypothetical protein